MIAASSVPAAGVPSDHQHVGDTDPFVVYARSLHDYTLHLWTESRRIAEEKARLKAAAGRGGAAAPQPAKRQDDASTKS